MASDQWQEEFGTEKKLQSDFSDAKIHLITVWHRIGTKNVQSNSLIPLASASLSSSTSMAIRFICRKNWAESSFYQHSRGRCTYLSDDPQTVKRKKKFISKNRESKETKRLLTWMPGGGVGGTPYNGLYGEAPPERGTFFMLQVEICHLGLWKSPKRLTDEFYGFIKSRKRSIFVIDSYLNDSAFTTVKLGVMGA